MEPGLDADWLEAWRGLEPVEGVDVVALIEAERHARGEHLLRVVLDRRRTR